MSRSSPFPAPKLRRIAYSVEPKNENSWKLMGRLGFPRGLDVRAENSDSGGITSTLYNPMLQAGAK